MTPRRVMLLQVAAITLVTLLAYSDSFDGEFVSDDSVSVVENEKIRALDRAHLYQIFTTFDDSNFIPIKVLSLAIDYRLWGPEPWGFHLGNLVTHIACALVVYALLLRLGLTSGSACAVALLWAVHPLQVESVAWISERKNVLSGLFFFAAFYVYVGFSEDGRLGRYVVLLVLYTLALFSKMNTMVLPALCVAYEMTVRRRLRWRDVAAAVPLLAMGAGVAWYNIAGNPIHGTAWHGNSRVVTWLSSSVVFFRYLGKLVMPVHLAGVYQVPLRDSLLDPPVLGAVLGLVALATLTIYLIATGRRAAFWILWLGITLAPMLNVLVPFRSMMQDRYMHLALLGPLVVVALAVESVAHTPGRRRVAAGAAVLAIAACTVLTYRQVEMWDNPVALWKGLALQFAYYGGDPGYTPPEYSAKVAFLTQYVAERPYDPVALNNLGTLHFAVGRIPEALALFEKAARHGPDDANVLTNLGNALLRSGRVDEAEDVLQRAAELDRYFYAPHVNLARVYLTRGDAAAARAELAECARISPNPSSAYAWRHEQAYLDRLEASQQAAGRR